MSNVQIYATSPWRLVLTSLETTSNNTLRDDIFKIKNVLSKTEEGLVHISGYSYVPRSLYSIESRGWQRNLVTKNKMHVAEII